MQPTCVLAACTSHASDRDDCWVLRTARHHAAYAGRHIPIFPQGEATVIRTGGVTSIAERWGTLLLASAYFDDD